MLRVIKPFLYRAPSILTLGLFLLAAGSCDVSKIEDTFNDLKLIVSLDPVETTVSGQIVDASTGELVMEDVQLTIQGTDAGEVIDMFSEPLTDITAGEGFITFGIRNSTAPTKSSPLSFSVRAEHYNYLPTSRDITLTRKGEHRFIIYMVNRYNAPQGSGFSYQNGNFDTKGANPDDIYLELENLESRTRSSVRIMKGTVMKDKAGNTLSGNYFVQFSLFGYGSPVTSRAFPGGYIGVDGKSLLPLVFTNLMIENNIRNRVKSFSGNITYTLRLRERTLNPATGQAFRVGDQLAVYSFDADEGVWQPEGTYMLQADGETGGLRLDYELNHLSYTTVSATVPEIASCSDGARININWLGARRTLSGVLNQQQSGLQYNFTLYPDMEQIKIPDSLGLLSVPGVPVELRLRLENGNEVRRQINNICEGNYGLDIPDAGLVDVNFTVNLKCYDMEEGVNLDDLPTSAVYYRERTAYGTPWIKVQRKPQWFFDEDSNELTYGMLKIHGLKMGSTYILTTMFDAESYGMEVDLNSSNSIFTKDTGTEDNQGFDTNENDYNYILDVWVTDEICG